ncbi:hypothetical protein B0J11DRAFT_311829 [Dendryphion nanum]|uniref:Uncharacterized protein n=1 Tax=Dendryphion nanum TaxID=256645 RepID=A0A9P9DUV1_9PLEO|nr:hypothetical protein B0J11DRAFT_311829 [Dendryphion nanum]
MTSNPQRPSRPSISHHTSHITHHTPVTRKTMHSHSSQYPSIIINHPSHDPPPSPQKPIPFSRRSVFRVPSDLNLYISQTPRPRCIHSKESCTCRTHTHTHTHTSPHVSNNLPMHPSANRTPPPPTLLTNPPEPHPTGPYFRTHTRNTTPSISSLPKRIPNTVLKHAQRTRRRTLSLPFPRTTSKFKIMKITT